MTEDPKAQATVVIRASRRSGLYLTRCIRSIIGQSVLPQAVVLVRQGTPDGLLESQSRELERNGIATCAIPGAPGLAAALNLGIGGTRTPWTAFLDDDDTWEPGFLRSLLPGTGDEESQRAARVCSSRIVFEIEGEHGLERIGDRPFALPDFDLTPQMLAIFNRFTLHSALWRTEALRALGGFREDLPVLEDWELNVRAAERFGFDRVPAFLANYHRRPPGAAHANTDTTMHDRVAALLRREWTERGLLPHGRLQSLPWLREPLHSLRRRRQRHMERVRWILRILLHRVRT